MVNKIKVLIGDDSVEYGIACASTLRGLGMYAVTRPKDGGVLFETIKNDMPDVIVVDAILPHMDAIELIKKVPVPRRQKSGVYNYVVLRQPFYRKAGNAERSRIFYAQAV